MREVVGTGSPAPSQPRPSPRPRPQPRPRGREAGLAFTVSFYQCVGADGERANREALNGDPRFLTTEKTTKMCPNLLPRSSRVESERRELCSEREAQRRGRSRSSSRWASEKETCLRPRGLFRVLSTNRLRRCENTAHVSAPRACVRGGVGPGRQTGAGTHQMLRLCSRSL